jgi:hypothetical protein
MNGQSRAGDAIGAGSMVYLIWQLTTCNELTLGERQKLAQKAKNIILLFKPPFDLAAGS